MPSSTKVITEAVMELYDRIVNVMEEKGLYLDSDLDIRMLAEAANSSRSVVSACINQNTGKPFRIWLSEYRLSLFVKRLREAPDPNNINELVLQCGYKDLSTFRRQFKTAYGMTAREYCEQLLKS